MIDSLIAGCGKCSSAYKAADKFCQKCGTPRPGGAVAAAAPAPVATTTAKPTGSGGPAWMRNLQAKQQTAPAPAATTTTATAGGSKSTAPTCQHPGCKQPSYGKFCVAHAPVSTSGKKKEVAHDTAVAGMITNKNALFILENILTEMDDDDECALCYTKFTPISTQHHCGVRIIIPLPPCAHTYSQPPFARSRRFLPSSLTPFFHCVVCWLACRAVGVGVCSCVVRCSMIAVSMSSGRCVSIAYKTSVNPDPSAPPPHPHLHFNFKSEISPLSYVCAYLCVCASAVRYFFCLFCYRTIFVVSFHPPLFVSPPNTLFIHSISALK